MRRIGFARKWIGWVMECISSVTYYVNVNGKVTREFEPTRGIRQGEPLSPYLMADVLSVMVLNAVQCGELKGINMSRDRPTVSHLFFANDSIFFLKATEENAEVLKCIIDQYCLASGQEIRMSKSSLFFSSNTREINRTCLCNCFGIDPTVRPGKYLGLPTEWRKSKSEALGYAKYKILLKLKD